MAKRKIEFKAHHFEMDGDVVRLVAYSTKGVAVRAIVDMADLEMVKRVSSWRAVWNTDFDSYIVLSKTAIKKDGRTVVRKDTVASIVLGCSPNAPIRHLNGDVLDNRRANLAIYDRHVPNDYEVIDADTAFVYLKDRYGRTVSKALITSTDVDKVIRSGYTWVMKRRASGQPYVVNLNDDLLLAHHLLACDAKMFINYVNKNPLDNRRTNIEIRENQE